MKVFCLFFIFTAALNLRSDNSLNDLVFDFSHDLKATLPVDGWIAIRFSMTHFSGRTMKLRFKASCVESGLELAYFPQKAFFELKQSEEFPVTLFMNKQCGKLDSLPSGQHIRTIRFQFTETEEKHTLVFEQPYVIEIP